MDPFGDRIREVAPKGQRVFVLGPLNELADGEGLPYLQIAERTHAARGERVRFVLKDRLLADEVVAHDDLGVDREDENGGTRRDVDVLLPLRVVEERQGVRQLVQAHDAAFRPGGPRRVVFSGSM